ncbi:hypothetical protein [Chryseobacterium sp. G0240]|nr:hypothetical protein [Chryseobacterium sp. G0240]
MFPFSQLPVIIENKATSESVMSCSNQLSYSSYLIMFCVEETGLEPVTPS